MAKILKLTAHDGSDIGYMGLKGDKFIRGVDKSDAVEFKMVSYDKDNDAHYFELVSKPKYYLDIKATNSVLFADKPFISVSTSTIVAWKEIDGELHAVLRGVDTLKAVSTSAADPDSKLMYGNWLLGDGKNTSCKVSVEEVSSALA
ncbi:hypothetical protein L1286_12980 [Pseudoalteromonas sp. SMS1]|uniref:hypothetical protein n=1 Tax=Pseudoalteromonas sp. SMS1 TaxID=2908894 RepID=UPI001F1CBFF0|nr:hypothetical protein [Pseudoalteromonas sp. SMS1]MCF2858395.1 hypothetical protein [Pseudoalteromonas sp. SMS1]